MPITTGNTPKLLQGGIKKRSSKRGRKPRAAKPRAAQSPAFMLSQMVEK